MPQLAHNSHLFLATCGRYSIFQADFNVIIGNSAKIIVNLHLATFAVQGEAVLLLKFFTIGIVGANGPLFRQPFQKNVRCFMPPLR